MTPTASHSYHYHWFSYYNGLREGRSLKPHHVRDGAAFAELSVPLQRRGLEYGRLIPNGPPTPAEFNERLAEVVAARVDGVPRHIEDVATYTPLDDSFLRPGDTVVVPTRLPLNDLDHDDKVRSQPGFTALEQKIFRITRYYLDVCSRSHVRLSRAMAEKLSAEYANRADVTFRQVLAPSYKELKLLDGAVTRVRRESHTTAAYVLRLNDVASLHGANLFVGFGMGGTHTLVLANRLRNDLDWVFEEPGFTMFEMTAQDEEAAKGGLECADRWTFDVVLNAKPLRESHLPAKAPARSRVSTQRRSSFVGG